MNTNTLFQLLQQSFRISVGATATLIETLQDPQKREQTLSELQSQFTQQTQEWAEKGEITEQEARHLIEQWLSQQNNSQQPSSSTTGMEKSPASSSQAAQGNIEGEIQELTEQVIALRTELENLRQSRS